MRAIPDEESCMSASARIIRYQRDLLGLPVEAYSFYWSMLVAHHNSAKAILLLLTTMAACIMSFGQDSDSAVRSKIAALEKAWNQAYKVHDVRALNDILDDSIVLINDDGSVQTKAEFLASVNTITPDSQEQQVAPESLNVKVMDKLAIATGTFRAKGIEAGKSYTRHERFVDTWVNKGGKWVCVASNATPIVH